MSKIKNFMMDVEEFCDGYLDSPSYTTDDIVLAADNMFRSTMAGDYAREYIATNIGELTVKVRLEEI